MHPLLQIENLNITFPDKNGNAVPVLSDISFSMQKGEILGLIGESGSGKTMTALAITNLLPKTASITNGQILFNGVDLRDESDTKRRHRLGNEITMIFQEPLSALDPIQRIRKQLLEICKAHRTTNHIPLEEALQSVGFSQPEKILRSYPHQLSGGQRQRILIAGALLLHPSLLIADESTTALDTVTQKQILQLLKALSQKYNIGVLFISHNLLLVKDFCSRVLVFEDDKIVDAGNPEKFLSINSHSSEYLEEHHSRELLQKASDVYDFLSHRKIKEPILGESAPILELKNISARYADHTISPQKNLSLVLKNISFSLYPDEIKGIVGVSGGGKTTLARIVTGLLPAAKGDILYNGNLYAHFKNGKKTNKSLENMSIGMIFQDPYHSLHPYMRIGRLLEEPLIVRRTGTKESRKSTVLQMLQDVGLSDEHLNYFPHQLSGGQRQRVSIALNLIHSPSIIVADEPLSAVDIPVQLQLIQLLETLQKKHGFSLLLISHDLHIVRALCHSICVIENGMIVEDAGTEQIFSTPEHEVTKRLLDANMLI